ncbi:MAG: hypothetical protein AB1649_16400 [Chloroflexota bacterium]
MPPQFKSSNELTEYLTKLEQRIETLEQENLYLAKRTPERILPATNILSQKFLSRAFAIWGHFMTANLIVTVTIGLIFYLFIIVIAMNAIVGPTQPPPTTATPWLPIHLAP